MPICKTCGGEIVFRHLGGAVTPIHLSGGCFGGGSASRPRSKPTETYTYSHADDFCRPTTCPRCHGRTFFLRHNGGSVWVDELGWPWSKHPCFDNAQGGAVVLSGLASAASPLSKPNAAIVVRVTFVPDSTECYAAIAAPPKPPVVWHVFDIADPRSLVGSLVVFSPSEKELVFRGVSHRIAVPHYRCVICSELVLATELDQHTSSKHGVRVCPVCHCFVRGAAFDEHLRNHKRDEKRRRRNA